jgi:hypothetical protein
MRFLVDPAGVRLELVGATFAFILCYGLPALAVKQHKALKSGAVPAPTRAQIYSSALVIQIFLLVITSVTAWRARIDLFPTAPIGAFEIGVGLVSLALGLPLLSKRSQDLMDPLTRERLQLMAPRGGRRGGYAAFYLVAIGAGFSEQLAYRGALFAILSAITGSWWISAVVTAAAFGLGHLFQGWRAVGVVTLIGLRDQIVVGLTGTLVVAMIVHAAHDILAGTVLGRRLDHDEGGSTLAVS